MSISIDRTVQWQAGAGTPVKYSFRFVGTSDLVQMGTTTATFSLVGTATLTNNPTNSQNSFAASDFAVLSAADKNPADYEFSPSTSYYESAIPFLPNAPQDYVNAILVEFRGDTHRPNPNRSSLYLKGLGLVADAISTESTTTYNIDTTFTITLTGNPDQPVLAWIQSGANSSTDYSWLDRQVWATLLDYDYRPGATWNGSEWVSHNRSSGAANIYTGSEWREMRTVNGPDGTDNPPFIRHSSEWKNQRKVGSGG